MMMATPGASLPVDPFELFRADPPAPLYDGLEDELRAVASGTKPVSKFVFPTSALEEEPAQEILDTAQSLGLEVVSVPNPNGPIPHTRVYAVHPDLGQHWRIHAEALLWKSFDHHGWTDLSEWLESSLLSDDPALTDRWMRWQWESHAAFGTKTVYALLQAAERERLRPLADRCFPADTALDAMRLFVLRERLVAQPDALDRIPAGWALARFALEHETARILFGRPVHFDDRGAAAFVFDGDVAVLNRGLRSRIQIFSTDRWDRERG